MKYNFCTLFDSYYLTRGIALYKSLEEQCNNFHLYIFAFDVKSQEILERLDFKFATIIPLSEFENNELLAVKPNRTIAEYCWTCTASTIWYSINKFNLDHCTYLDADMRFFSSPDPVFNEIGSNSIGITPHNFSRRLKSSEVYGKYCVQFIYFKNDPYGLEALNWWKNSCIEWCYAKLEDEKYGDQKYLDYFEEKFKDVHIISNPGSGVAPWNVSMYRISESNNGIAVNYSEYPEKKYPLIFYHYQGLRFTEKDNKVISKPSKLWIHQSALNFIYKPYIFQLQAIKYQLEEKSAIDQKIIFKRSYLNAFGVYFSLKIKNVKVFRNIYFFVKRSRYNQPRNIGGSIK